LKHYAADVVVVGAGPAGSSTAIRLAEMGYDTLLVDRASFPRPKPCGEFLNPAAMDLLSELGVDVDVAGATPIHAARLHVPNVPHLDLPLVDSKGVLRPGRSLARVRTDELLVRRAEAAGARLLTDHAVREMTEDGVQGIDFRIAARMVIAADGTHSVIARQLGLVRPIERLRRIGLSAHFQGVDPDPSAVEMFASHGELGVGGFAPQIDGGGSLSWVLPKEAATRIAGRSVEIVEEIIASHAPLRDRLRGAKVGCDVRTVPCFGHRLRSSFADGVLFVGDAARFVDPFTGEGVHHALEGGMLAAEVTHVALTKGGTSAADLAPYAARRRALDRRYLLSDLVQFLVHHPRVLARVAHGLRGEPAEAERLIGAITDIRVPESLLHPRFLRAALSGGTA